MSKMYTLKPLLPEFDIKLPTCMYPMKMLNGAAPTAADANSATPTATTFATSTVCATKECGASTAATAAKCARVLDLDQLGIQIQKLLKSTNDAEVIICRQDKVLQQLNELKAQLAGMRKSLGLCQKGPQHNTSYKTSNDSLPKEQWHTQSIEVPLDLVIKARPTCIPYAFLGLKNAWKDLVTIDFKCYKHSSLRELCAEAKEFERKLTEAPAHENKPKISMTLIWTECAHTEIVIAEPRLLFPVHGDANFIRYLGRVGPPEYRYEDSPFCNEIDTALEASDLLLRSTTPASRAWILSALDRQLQHNKYFGGEQMSIADIAVNSSLKRMHVSANELSAGLKKWLKCVQAVTLLNV